ncbi:MULTISPECIES: hypothetical protein [unclassified Ensifer]|uniref:hypothetical protein n=1 Tax=unclassified Ensifer TaxID=2633371 RepID=UPI00081306CE|nr:MULTISPECIES: hypothetical protein [unclassified Ensifer]OCP17770.1 hypothetical protein BC361_10195 [Ensifer sp. LC54]OCP28324.1 hypothetical protein BC363_00170 [Ensifer sp. LC384]OCP38666.1 hypothetical protein BC360_00930 [Ensifer sp. LC163]
MASNLRLHCNPTNLELVRETSPEDARDWLFQQLGGVPQHIVERFPDPEIVFAPLLDAMTPGDSLWFCRSQKKGPLYGEAGVALVRDGQPILYMRLLNY